MTDIEVFKAMVSKGTICTQPDQIKIWTYFFEGNHIVFIVDSFHGMGSHRVTLAPWDGTWSSGIRAVCSCKKDKYWAFQYIRGSVIPRFTNFGNVGKGNTAPKVNNTELRGVACHHILSAAMYIIDHPEVLSAFAMYRQSQAVRAFTAKWADR